MDNESSDFELNPDKLARLWEIGSFAGEPSCPEDNTSTDAAPQIEGYQVVGRLGEGGMGTVWSAVQLSTHRKVALKVMNAKAFGSRKVLSRFEREVELAAQLQHPNITRVYDSGLHQGLYYYVMELIEGQHLDSYVEQHRLAPRQILTLMRTVCKTIQYAHQLGIIHRDLKPSNILISEDGQPHVLDFGLAKRSIGKDSSLSLSVDGETVGTLPYMSPEQAAGRQQQQDTRTDVYSLGLILYRLLTGRPPHDLSGTQYTIMRRIAEEDVVRPQAINKHIDEELEAILLKALARGPDDRYNTAGDLAEDIDRYLNGEPVTAKSPTTMYFLRKHIKKHRIKIAVVCLVTVAVIGTMVLAATLSRHRRLRAVRQFKAEAAELLKNGAYEEAQQTFVKVLALDKEDSDARAGITRAQSGQELDRELTLAERYLSDSRYDLALGLALSLQRRFPDEPRVPVIVRRAKGTTKLRVAFNLGILIRATLRKVTSQVSEPAVEVPVSELLNSDGIDLDPGWYWLNLYYNPAELEDDSRQKKQQYLLCVQRGTPCSLHVKRVLVGKAAGADFVTLTAALQASEPGTILLLSPGEHQLSGRFLTPNLTIESEFPDRPAVIDIVEARFVRANDIRIANVKFHGVGPVKQWPGVLDFGNAVHCRVIGCTFEAALIDMVDCDGIEIAFNNFQNPIHHRLYAKNSKRVLVHDNLVGQVDKVGIRTFDFVDCNGVLVYGNEIRRSGEVGIRFRICSNVMLAANRISGNLEGNVYLEHSHKAILACNSLLSTGKYNISLFDSHNNVICHNWIAGGENGFILSTARNGAFNRNLIVDSDNVFFFVDGAGNIISNNILKDNLRFLAKDEDCRFDAEVESNLTDMELELDPVDTAAGVKGDGNIYCDFKLGKVEPGYEKISIEIEDANEGPELENHTFGPDLSLSARLVSQCNAIAEAALAFVRPKSSIPTGRDLGEDLTLPISELVNSMSSSGPPKKTSDKHIAAQPGPRPK